MGKLIVFKKVLVYPIFNILFRKSYDHYAYSNLIKRLGSNYGGWHIINSNISSNTKVLSIGSGEDISFDIELANEFGCFVDIYDPTPRAIRHFKKTKPLFGNCSTSQYSKTGTQPVSAYKMNNIKTQIQYFEKAIWLFDGDIEFFLPKKKENVSHSIISSNSKFGYERQSLNVKCADILSITLDKYDIIKMDIEGAEVEVLRRFVKNKNFGSLPNQILVEFDALRSFSLMNLIKVYLLDKEIKKIGFKLIHKDGLNFTYTKPIKFTAI